jgi:hypothetical protein
MLRALINGSDPYQHGIPRSNLASAIFSIMHSIPIPFKGFAYASTSNYRTKRNSTFSLDCTLSKASITGEEQYHNRVNDTIYPPDILVIVPEDITDYE